MEIPCPACRKLNVAVDGPNTVCVRCGCELGNLVALARAAQSELQDAAEALRTGHVQKALEHAARSWQLRRSRLAAAAAALAAAAMGDEAELERWHAHGRAGDA